jgi:branched-chain amino acid transport system permease protein
MNTPLDKNHLSSLKKNIPYLVLIAGWAIMPAFVRTSFWLHTFIVVFIRCVGAVGLRTIALSGNLSFAQAAFIGLSAYVSAYLSKTIGMPVHITIPIATVITTVLAIATGFPFVRLRSVYFSMSTLFFGVAIIYALSALPALGGSNGMNNIPGLFRRSSMLTNYYFFFALAIVSCLIMYRFEFSRIGTTLRALAQSPDAAAAMGVNEVYFRLLAVGLGSFFAGLMGSSFAHYNTSLSPSSYGMAVGMVYIMYVMIGGQDRFIGPIVGTILLYIIPELSRGLSQYAPYVTAAALILIAYFLPGGLASLPEAVKTIVTGRKRKRNATEAEGGV